MKSQFIAGRSRSMTGNAYLVAHTDRPKCYCRAPALPPTATFAAAICYVRFTSWFAEPPTKEPTPRVLTNADLRKAGEKSAGPRIARDLSDLAFELRRSQSADKLVERLSANEREEVLPRHRGRDADQSGS